MYEDFLNELNEEIKILKKRIGANSDNTHLYDHTPLIDIIEKNADVPVKEWDNNTLQLMHTVLHKEYRKKKSDTIKKLHDDLVSELTKRNMKHTDFDNLDI